MGNHNISRRDLLKYGGLTAAGAIGVSALTACSGGSSNSTTNNSSTTGGDNPLSFLAKPAAITNIKETKTYDVVVVGAGAAGVPAALSALEAGASVAVVQKESTAVSQGNTGSAIDVDNSDPAGVEALVSQLMCDNNNRPQRAFLELWARNGAEAVKWVIDRSGKGGAQVVDQGNAQEKSILTVNGYKLNYVTSFFGPKPYSTGDGMKAMADYAAKQGVEFFYSTPAQQLVMDGTRVKGVICQNSDETYTEFDANKGVILAAGDYQNDEAMCDYYIPDLTYFERKQYNKTGDGHKMGVWAGGHIEPLNHTKMLHDFDAGPASMCDMPFLSVNDKAVRFVNETTPMSWLNNYLRQEERTGWYSQVFDSDYMTQAASWPGALVDPEGLKNYMPEEPGTKTGVTEAQIRTFKADTLEELAKKLEIDATTFVKTVDEYNKMVEAGADTVFGKPAKYLVPVKTAPFYGIHRHVRISATCSGLSVDTNLQVLDSNDVPIDGLFAIGECAGYFYGGIDYPLTVPGLNLGHCYTFGYLTGKHVAAL
jgi:fumarate reductase flavoprotein subunit